MVQPYQLYPPNTIQWEPGDLVLQDEDPKVVEYLMVVLGYDEEGRCRTKYALPHGVPPSWRETVWSNPIRLLHDPGNFEIMLKSVNDHL